MKIFYKCIIFLIVSIFIVANCTGNGFSMTKHNYLDQAINGEQTIRQLLMLDKAQEIEYAGRYISKGILHIKLVYSSAKNISQEELLKRISAVNKEGKIHFSNADFTYDELKSYNDILVDNMETLSKYGLVSIELSDVENRIIVTIKDSKDNVILNKLYALANKKALLIRNADENVKAQF